MTNKDSIADIQEQFANWVRGHQPQPIAVDSPERVAVYQSLVSTIFKNALDRAFPIARKHLGQNWNQVVLDFIKTGCATEPALWKLPAAFVNYAQTLKLDKQFKLPFLIDLLIFEWTEIYIYMMPDSVYNTTAPTDTKSPIFNQDSTILRLTYPVFKPANSQQLTASAGEYFLLVYRHTDLLNVNFIELSPLLAISCELFKNKHPLTEVTRTLLAYFPNLTAQEVETTLSQFIIAMLQQGVFIQPST